MKWDFYVVVVTTIFLASVGMSTLITPLLNRLWQKGTITKRLAGMVWFMTMLLTASSLVYRLLLHH